ncbi:hypothetical protein DFH28DRAFT_1058381 [Melampsora americana]|nr:hypothetical protein DFH28DRAFT_1058381 [Melampsora americana]
MLSFFVIVLTTILSHGGTRAINTSPLKLAVQPECGSLSSAHFNNFNTGIDLKKIKTIYGFGDSYTSNGQYTGSPPPPALRDANDPKYGQRASNGLVWIEQFGNQIGALVKDYAVGGASVSRVLSPSVVQQTDMIEHVQTFLDQHNHIDAASSMAMISYGINDWSSAHRRGVETLASSAKELLRQTERIIHAGIRNVVVISPPFVSDPLIEFDNIIWSGLKAFRTRYSSLQIAYVDWTALYTAITVNPHSFGYQSLDSCLPSSTSMAGACKNPDVYLHYLPRHPQKLTHGLMAEWVQNALSKCGSPKTT